MKYLSKFDKLNEGGFFKKLKKERSKDLVLKKADEEIKKHLNRFLNQDYPFQYSVYVWKSNSENYQEIDIADFKLVNIMVHPRYDWDTGKVTEFFLYLYFIDRYDDEVVTAFEPNSPTEKMLDLEYCKPWDKKTETSFSATYADDDDDIDYNDPTRYPTRKGGGAMDLVPADYKTYQLLSEIKSTLEIINSQID